MVRIPGGDACPRILRDIRKLKRRMRRLRRPQWSLCVQWLHIFWICVLTLLTLVLLRDYNALRKGGKGSQEEAKVDVLLKKLGWGVEYKRREYVFQNPGYAQVRPGTFRDKYPTTAIVSDKEKGIYGAFDAVFVITHKECPDQWHVFRDHIKNTGMRVTQVNSATLNDLRDSTLPLNKSIRRGGLSSMQKRELKRNLGYYMAHRRVWDLVIERKYSRVLVTDSTLFPTNRLLHNLPDMFNAIDTESVALRRPWHLVYFRRYPAEVDVGDSDEVANASKLEEPWTIVHDFGRKIVQTIPSYGAGMYGLSTAGARLLRKHAYVYSVILDVQLALLQRELKENFVVLTPCGLQRAARDRCADLVDQVLGDSAFQCIWRRLQDGQMNDRKLNEVEY